MFFSFDSAFCRNVRFLIAPRKCRAYVCEINRAIYGGLSDTNMMENFTEDTSTTATGLELENSFSNGCLNCTSPTLVCSTLFVGTVDHDVLEFSGYVDLGVIGTRAPLGCDEDPIIIVTGAPLNMLLILAIFLLVGVPKGADYIGINMLKQEYENCYLQLRLQFHQ